MPPDSGPIPIPRPISHRPVRVRMVESLNGETSRPALVASFPGRRAAEAFMRREVMKCENFGTVANRHWGRHDPDHQFYYWIESDQETASVKDRVEKRPLEVGSP